MSSIYGFEWQCDAVGNRTYQERGSAETYYEYDAANALTQRHELDGASWSYSAYDSRGNTTQIKEPDGSTYFAYNHADLVTSIHYKSGIWNYFHYDAQLRRHGLQDSGGLSYFAWDRNGMNLLCERDSGEGQPQRSGRERLDKPLSQT